MSLSQNDAPLYEALLEYKENRIVSFDVPGHKQGKGNSELTNFLGKQCMSVDVNSMKPLDNLCHPVSVIKEAQELAAEAFGAAHAFFMVNGTSSAVQAMVMSVCKRGEKIIMPRNVHRSSINALIVCGAVPVYVDPGLNTQLGIPLGMAVEDVQRAIDENPDAKAVIVNNPTYYGVCSNLREIVKIAHKAGMKVLVDEAHGTHFYFGDYMPLAAMRVGADMSAVSMHKTGGSLTQSSLLLLGESMNAGYVRQIINLTQTTSGSYLLTSSLDISRRNLALNGKRIFENVTMLANYGRSEVNKLGGYYAFSRELINGDTVFDFDPTKLKKIDGVYQISNRSDIARKLTKLNTLVTYIGIAAVIVLGLVTLFIRILHKSPATVRKLHRQNFIDDFISCHTAVVCPAIKHNKTISITHNSKLTDRTIECSFNIIRFTPHSSIGYSNSLHISSTKIFSGICVFIKRIDAF